MKIHEILFYMNKESKNIFQKYIPQISKIMGEYIGEPVKDLESNYSNLFIDNML